MHVPGSKCVNSDEAVSLLTILLASHMCYRSPTVRPADRNNSRSAVYVIDQLPSGPLNHVIQIWQSATAQAPAHRFTIPYHILN